MFAPGLLLVSGFAIGVFASPLGLAVAVVAVPLALCIMRALYVQTFANEPDVEIL